MRINDSIFLGAIVPELDNGALVIQQNKRILFLSLLSRLIEVVVRGIPPLALPDAVAAQIPSLIAYGGTEFVPETYLDAVTARGKCEQRNVPTGYTELEYIQSTGTQYIDTGVSGNATIKITAQASTIKGSSQALLSSTSGAQGGTWFGEFTTNQKWGIGTGAGLTTIAPTTKITAEIAFDGNGCSGTVNGESVTRSATSPQGSWYMMNDGGNSYPFSGKVWNCQIAQNGTLVRNFIPCKNAAGVVGMFDTVSQTFFANAGTGTFIAGPMAYMADGYTPIQYVENTSGTYVDLGVAYNDANSYMAVTAVTQNTNYIFCAREGNVIQGIAGGSTSSFKAYIDPVNLTSTTTKTAGHKYNFAFRANNGNATFETEDETATTGDTQTAVYTVSQTQPTAHLCLFGNTFGNVSDTGMRIYNASYYVNGAPVLVLVPARHGATIGLYNMVDGQFFTATQGSLMAGADVASSNPVPTPDVPVDIWCNNGAIKLSRNLYSGVNDEAGYLTDVGTVTTDSRGTISDYIEILPSTTYTLKLLRTAEQIYTRVCSYNSSKNFVSLLVKDTSVSAGYVTATFTTDATAKYVRISFKSDSTEVQLERGSVATPYRPYGIYTDGTVETITDDLGNAATCQKLLSVGTYEDTQEVISGAITHNVGVKVLDGTENWQASAPGYFLANVFSGLSSIAGSLCTHFTVSDSNSHPYDMNIDYGGVQPANLFVRYDAMTTLSSFKQFLADQYAAGTPVIIVYPLATATTESVAGQTLLKAPLTTVGSLENLVVTPTSSSHTVPTPTQPLDINTNNGVLKPRHQSGLPLGYTALEYIESTGTQYIDTGVTGVCELTMIAQGTNSQPLRSEIVAGSAHENSASWFGVFSSQTNWQRSDVPFTTKVNILFQFKEPPSIYTIDNQTYETSSGSYYDTRPIKLFGIDPYMAHVRIFKATFTQNGITVRNFIPVKQISDNAIGMYDTISNTFFTNKGTGDFVAGSAVSDPVEIYTDGTVETINVHGKNLFGGTYETLANTYIDASGTYRTADTVDTYRYFKVRPSTTCTISGKTTRNGGMRIAEYTSNKTFVVRSAYLPAPGIDLNPKITITTTATTEYLAMSIDKEVTDIQLELGSTATDYEPYFDGGTATCEDLLSVGTYTDEQEVISGGVTRKVGVKVLDGTENWTIHSSGSMTIQIPHPQQVQSLFGYSTHFVGVQSSVIAANMSIGQYKLAATNNDVYFKTSYNNTTDWTAFLAQQYAAGTPVIVVYPLATPITETVTGQPMSTAEGDNIVEITQASMSGLELEVTYTAGVVLTVEEVEDAQLSPDVEVTIQ